MKILKNSIKAIVLVLLICIAFGCGDEDNTLPLKIDAYPQTYDLSSDSNYHGIDISITGYDSKGEPIEEGTNAIISINKDAKGYLALGDVRGFQLSSDFEGGMVNFWYIPVGLEETVTVTARIEQYPHVNILTTQLYIINQTLRANFEYAVADLTVNFYNLSVPGTPDAALTYLWDFGDGNTSTATNPTHIYAAADAGSPLVTLTVNEAGATDTVFTSVTVTAPAAP